MTNETELAQAAAERGLGFVLAEYLDGCSVMSSLDRVIDALEIELEAWLLADEEYQAGNPEPEWPGVSRALLDRAHVAARRLRRWLEEGRATTSSHAVADLADVLEAAGAQRMAAWIAAGQLAFGEPDAARFVLDEHGAEAGLRLWRIALMWAVDRAGAYEELRRCSACGQPADLPARQYATDGRVVGGCFDVVHERRAP